MNLSDLPKTWILDLDGTLLKHNGHKDGEELLPGAKEFIDKIPKDDTVLILTARKKNYEAKTISFLKKNKIRYDYILFNMPVGERILINDIKPRGLLTAHSYNINRNEGLQNLLKEIF